ncbi:MULTISPECIES: hypothetical protein [Paenibacillus]|uniref:Uncharacterized protein n=1 Tax=Paenibacillus odorifer TaxID=189426 RepID=A0AB36J6A2_9BACL|nr:hypothetical protein [Paenibacillus odorifer]OMC99917.1 hypothetical protein BJP49_28800 [Paenibacillus odorifer]OMD10015.1 hypothetical protein BJP50_28895 [Paenibacillus odorifer]OME09735.1 hypothetical protein BSK47_31885 [Paenibacillus odorifer]
MKNKLSLVLMTVLFFVILLPSHSSAAEDIAPVTDDVTAVVNTSSPPADISPLSQDTFSYEFSSNFYTPTFHVYNPNTNITVNLTSTSTYDSNDGVFKVSLEKCDKSGSIVCTWKSLLTAAAPSDGAWTVLFPGGFETGDYRIRLHGILPGGYTVKGYAQYIWY